METVARAESDVAGADNEPPAPAASSTTLRRLIVTAIVVALTFGAGAGAGMAVADDGTELAAAQNRIERSQAKLDSLAATVAEVREENKALAADVNDAEASAEAASQETEAKERRFAAREDRLDKREAELDSRAAELDEQEASLDATDGFSAAPSSQQPASDFDRAWAADIASDIVQDVKTVDHRLGDGIAVESAMFLLSGNFPRLLDVGIPPGVAEGQYVARLQTLESFTDEAADLYSSDPMQGSARYAVVREQTGVLLEQLNAATGSDFTLP